MLNSSINDIDFHGNWKFYYLKDKSSFVLAIDNSDNTKLVKIRYSLGGVLINRVVDCINNGKVLRKSGTKDIILGNNEVIEFRQNINVKPIATPAYNPLFISNPLPPP